MRGTLEPWPGCLEVLIAEMGDQLCDITFHLPMYWREELERALGQEGGPGGLRARLCSVLDSLDDLREVPSQSWASVSLPVKEGAWIP